MRRLCNVSLLGCALVACQDATPTAPDLQQEPEPPTSTAPVAPVAAAAHGGGPSADVGAAGSGEARGPEPARPAEPVSGSPPAAFSCDEPFARATRMTLTVSWPETLGLVGGSGPLVTWSKKIYSKSPEGNLLVESRPCGTLAPTLTTTALAGGLKSMISVPLTVFDDPAIPVSRRMLSWQEGTPVTLLEAGVLGATLTDPEGAWPSIAELVPADHDGDGAPGMTSVPQEGPDYQSPPTNISQIEFLDALYTASRLKVERSFTPTCDADQDGPLRALAFDTTVLGCHVKDRGNCTDDELAFITAQRVRFALEPAGLWMEANVPLDASCEAVRTALPVP